MVDQAYKTIPANDIGLWSQVLSLYLGVHEGQLRYFSADGELIPTPAEAANQARAQAQQSQLSARQFENRAEQLAEQLRRLGIDPEA